MLSSRGKVCLIIAVASLLPAMVFLAHPASGLYPPCIFHTLTALHCAGCGSTRAMHTLLRGDLSTAFGHNPLLVLMLPALAYGLMCEVSGMLGMKILPKPALPGKWVWGLVIIIFLYWIARNIPVGPFPYLAP